MAPKLSALVLFLLFAVLGLTVTASPLDVRTGNSDALTLVVERATNHTGKFVGSKCKTNDECYSKNCVSGTCQRQPAGGPCFKNSNCQSRNCDLSNGTCSGKLLPDASCSADSDCVSNSCIDCFQTHAGLDCFHDAYRQDFCARYPLGHSCTGPNQCDEGLCKAGKCSKSKVGDSCTTQFQCTDDQVCTNGGCQIPAKGSLRPTEQCASDSQCISGTCSPDIQYRDNYGINTGDPYDADYSPPYSSCTYLNNGQSGCSSTDDCFTGVCDKGVCRAALDGEECDVNYRCVNVCGLDGICYTPPNNYSLPVPSPCSANSQCASHNCEYHSLTRLTLSHPRTSFPSYGESGCNRGGVGRPCASKADCYPAITCDVSQGKCADRPEGSTCKANIDCNSYNCSNGKCKQIDEYVYYG
ncbi:hypothetical protein OC834_000312 [Tilletia horrida]|nr:hypothetical protein OC834_000312 [Tilletia horrida]